VVAIVGRTELTMRTVKQLIAIGFAITAAIVGAGAVGIGAVEHSATLHQRPLPAFKG
jgi:hypothetical protein